MTYYPPDLQKWGEGSVGFSALTSNATCKLLSRRDMAVPLASQLAQLQLPVFQVPERSERLCKRWQVHANTGEVQSQKSVIFGCLFLCCGVWTHQQFSGNSRCPTATCHLPPKPLPPPGLSCHCPWPGPCSGGSATSLLQKLSALGIKSRRLPRATGSPPLPHH